MDLPAGDGAPSCTRGPAPAELRLSQVSFTFSDGTNVLQGVDLDVRPGEFVSIIGPSGCGKSTLLRLAAGLLPPSSGRVERARPDVGYVFQDPTLLPWRTVLKNIELFGELHRMPRGELRLRARAVLDMTGLAGSEDKYPKALSGGMKMRASLARSLILQPRLFLFDEPFAAVDEITRQHLNDELIRLFSREQFAGLFVTHSVTEACYLASRVVVMTARPGRIHEQVHLPFGYPREESLRYEPGFVERAQQLSTMLHQVVAA
jgi:NitT/TauT family transport system ATP-binding protein